MSLSSRKKRMSGKDTEPEAPTRADLEKQILALQHETEVLKMQLELAKKGSRGRDVPSQPRDLQDLSKEDANSSSLHGMELPRTEVPPPRHEAQVGPNRSLWGRLQAASPMLEQPQRVVDPPARLRNENPEAAPLRVLNAAPRDFSKFPMYHGNG